jgi:hypothetical protein
VRQVELVELRVAQHRDEHGGDTGQQIRTVVAGRGEHERGIEQLTKDIGGSPVRGTEHAHRAARGVEQRHRRDHGAPVRELCPVDHEPGVGDQSAVVQ